MFMAVRPGCQVQIISPVNDIGALRFLCRNAGIAEKQRVGLTDCSALHGLIRRSLQKTSWRSDMAKERKTAEQLAGIIVDRIGIRGVEVRVRQDHADGWCPTIV